MAFSNEDAQWLSLLCFLMNLEDISIHMCSL